MAADDEPLGREVWIVAAVVVVGVIMSILDTTIVNVALETLSRELNAPLNTIQWVSTGYLLALATVIPLTGWMTERFGSKRIWMISVALFGIGSALCGLAWSAESLIFFRVLQGFGGGMIMPVGMALLAQTAGAHRVGRVMSVVGVPMLLGPILGPVIGGLIVDSASWRWIFYVNVPIAAAALVLAARLLKADAGRADAGRLDWTGLALLSPGLAGVVFGLSESESHGGFSDPLVWGPIVVGLVLVALFVRHAWRAERPLIDVRLFRDRVFAAASATTFLIGGALFGAMIILPLYYQVARGESALTAGLLMAPQGLGAAAAMPIAGKLTDKLGGGRVAVAGLLILTVGTIPFAFLKSDTSYTLLALLLVLRGLGIGSSMMPSMAAAYASLERCGGAARDERAQRGAAGRRLARHGAARRHPAGADQGPARRRGRRRRRDARAAAGQRAGARGRAAGRRVRRHLLVGGRDVGARARARGRARGDAEARAGRGGGSGRARRAGGVKPLFEREWEPEGDPRAVVALVHGLGEHSGRYEHVAARFTAAGLAVRALDLRGHGRSPGPRGATRFEPAVADLAALVRRCGERGAPVFVYGHSLGALIAALWLVREPAPPVAGAVLSAIGLHSALREQAAKVRAARVLGRVLPKVRVKSGIDPATLSRDPAVVEAYREDKLVHDTASLGFGLDALEAIDEIAAGAPRLAVPLLVIHGGEDQLAYASGARELAALAPAVTTLHVYDGLFHEIHHEPERERVLGDVLAWIELQLGN